MMKTCSQVLADAAQRAVLSLADESRAGIVGFILKQQQADGGFRGRSSASDLYYTYFAVQALTALGEPLPVVALSKFLEKQRRGTIADLVNLACLACVSARINPGRRDDDTLLLINRFRGADGGFREKVDAGQSSAYACYLAVQAHEAQGVEMTAPGALMNALKAMAPSVTPALAAKVMLLACLGEIPDSSDAESIMKRASRKGGFRAAALAPIPDLLSTATALCALSVTRRPLETVRGSCTEFVDSLWNDNGGFSGHWADRTADCEYTYYALLSLGLLAQ